MAECVESDSSLALPPAKRNFKYRWCPHCNQQVAERTYRSHRALYFSDGTSQCGPANSSGGIFDQDNLGTDLPDVSQPI